MNDSPNLATIREWLDDYVRKHFGLQKPLYDEALFRQIDSFAVIEFLLACDEAFGLGDRLGGDALTSLTLEEIAAFIVTHTSKRP